MKLSSSEKDIIENFREAVGDACPEIDDMPYILPCKKGLWVSMLNYQDGRDASKTVKWGDFENWMFEQDQEMYDEAILSLEKSLARMKRREAAP